MVKGIYQMQDDERPMRTNPYNSVNSHALIFVPDTLRNFHKNLPLAGYPPNAILSLPDDHLNYLIAAIRNTPISPPDLSLDNWHKVLSLLRPHWILPLITYHLRTWPKECQPPEQIMEYMNKVFLMAAARTMLAGRQIQTVTDALKDAGISVILLKGHALARTVYPHPALRQSSDIDLIVQPRNMPAAELVLEKRGYVCSAKTFHMSKHEHHHETFSPQNKGLHIELHWVTDNAYDLFTEGWLDDAFSRRIPIRSEDLSCDTFGHADHLLFLAFHNVFQHGSLRLDWVYDISRIMREFTTTDDWKELGRQSVRHHIRVPLELSLTAAHLWTGCRLPMGVEDFSVWPVPSERELRLIKYSATHHTSLYSWVYLVMQGQPGILGKLRFGWHFFLPPSQLLYEYRRSPSRADIPLAHLRRWMSIVKYR